MAKAKAPKEPTEFGHRLLKACSEEGRSPTSSGFAAGLGKGYISRMIYGDRGGTSFNVEHMRALAKLLRVKFEWLVTGDGPMRESGWRETPLDQTLAFARSQGAREDAITAALERNKDRASEMTATELLLAIDAEARQLERAGTKRPEKVATEQTSVRRQKKRLERAVARGKEQVADEHAPPTARKRRASGGG